MKSQKNSGSDLAEPGSAVRSVAKGIIKLGGWNLYGCPTPPPECCNSQQKLSKSNTAGTSLSQFMCVVSHLATTSHSEESNSLFLLVLAGAMRSS